MHKNYSLRTYLGKVKGLGSAKTGVHHWWMQRLSAIALIPLILWFIALFVKISFAESDEIVSLITSQYNTIVLVLFIVIGLYHGTLGMHEIIEDYVHCHAIKIALTILLNFTSIITGFVGFLAVLVIHLYSPLQI